MIRRVLVALIIFPYFCYSQTEIVGKIIDTSSEPCEAASVVLKDKEGNVISFSISDVGGRYKLKIKQSLSYPVNIEVNALGYKSVQKEIDNKVAEPLNFVLSRETINLDEHIVKYIPPVRVRKDTVEYDVATFTSPNDIVIGDIIRKLPGVNIDNNGKIFYQGREINKYYVEGLDMLGKRYNLANDNISVFDVDKVQILERHQPIKMLDGVQDSENAAINLKLKKDYTITGQLNGSVGGSPILWEGKASPMYFSRRMQGMFLAETNNIGRNLSQYDFANLVFGHDLTSIGGLSGARWRKSKNHIMNGNALFKTKNEFQIKPGFSLNFLEEKFSIDTQTDFRTLDENVVLNENINSQDRRRNYSGNLVIEKNSSRFFLENNFFFTKMSAKKDINTLLNDSLFTQTNQNISPQFSNSFKIVLPVKKNLGVFSSNFKILSQDTPLFIRPGVFESLISSGEPYQQISQFSISNNFHLRNSIAYILKLKGLTIETKIEQDYNQKAADSHISIINDQNHLILGNDFKNNQTIRTSNLLFNAASEFRIKDFLVKMKPNISYLKYSISDNLKDSYNTNEKFSFEPYVSVNKSLGSLFNLHLAGNRNSRFGSMTNVNTGYRVSSFREINRHQMGLVENYKSYTLLGKLEFKDVFTSTFAHLQFSKIFTNSDMVDVTDVSTNGQIFTNTFTNENKTSNMMISGEIGKYFQNIKLTSRLIPSYSSSSRFMVINSELAKVNNSNIGLNLFWNMRPFDWINMDGKHGYNIGKSKFLQTQFTNQQWNHLLKASIIPFELHTFEFTMDITTYGNKQKEIPNSFLDISYRLTLKNKWKIKAQLNNILNHKQYFSRSFELNSLTESRYQLRPLEILVGFETSFR